MKKTLLSTVLLSMFALTGCSGDKQEQATQAQEKNGEELTTLTENQASAAPQEQNNQSEKSQKIPPTNQFKEVGPDFFDLYDAKVTLMGIDQNNDNLDGKYTYSIGKLARLPIFDDKGIYKEFNDVLLMDKAKKTGFFDKVAKATEGISEIEYIKVPILEFEDLNGSSIPHSRLTNYGITHDNKEYFFTVSLRDNTKGNRFSEGEYALITEGPLSKEQVIELASLKDDIKVKGTAYYVIHQNEQKREDYTPAYFEYEIVDTKNNKVLYKGLTDKYETR